MIFGSVIENTRMEIVNDTVSEIKNSYQEMTNEKNTGDKELNDNM